LHFETQEWLREVSFYKEELNCQFELITQMIGGGSIDDQLHKDIFRNINSMLDHLTNESTTKLKQHEDALIEGMKIINTVNKAPFYKQHQLLASKVKLIKEGIFDLKEAIHNYIDENRIQYRTEILDLDI
jgi:predicted glycoside hydrolase/deacetylase ChbG (UPF0249 family)